MRPDAGAAGRGRVAGTERQSSSGRTRRPEAGGWEPSGRAPARVPRPPGVPAWMRRPRIRIRGPRPGCAPMTALDRIAIGALALLSAVALTGCARGCPSSRPPIHINPSMDDQPKVRPQAASQFFYDGASMRAPVPGTVPIGELKEDEAFFTGKGPDGEFVAVIPMAVDEALVARGRGRYRIYCEPCHDVRGDGRGILFQRGNVPTASFHQEKILQYPDGQIFDVITNGQGLMAGYRWPIPPADRWAIVAYVRQLQRERQARAAASPAPASGQ